MSSSKHSMRWSNSWQSWQERAAALMLLVAAAAVYWFGGRLDAIVQVILWGMLALIGAVMLRRGWLKLFGPLLFYDLVRIARRGRFIWIRFLYACLLFLFLATAYSNSRVWHQQTTSRQQASILADNYFQTFMSVQLIAVALLTPAYVAGAIAEEKEKRTLEFMFATDLRNREIVLSKLGARVANLTLFLLTGLPILSMVQFLGGVDPNLVLAGFAATGMTMLGMAGLSMFFSVLSRKPRDAIALTYLAALAYMGLSLFSLLAWNWSILSMPLWFGSNPITVHDALLAFQAGNLLIVLFRDIASAMGPGQLGTVVPTVLRNYSIFHGLLALATISWSIWRVRHLALIQQSEPKRRLARWLTKFRPQVSDNPVHWKEVFVEGGARLGWIGYLLIAAVVLMTLWPGYYLLVNMAWEWLTNPFSQRLTNASWGYTRDINVWVRYAGTIVACLLLLSVAVRASTAISGEKERQTFDTLLTTPLDSDTLLHAKWLGSLTTVRIGWIWLALIWVPALLVGALHVGAAALLLVSWLIYAGVCAIIGLWFSMVCRNSLRATVSTIAVLTAVTIGHWFIWMICGPLLFMGGPSNGAEAILKFQAGITPPVALGIFAFMSADFREMGNEFPEMLGFGIVGTFLWTVAGVFLWVGALSPNFRTLTRREDYVRPGFGFVEPEAAPPPTTAALENIISLHPLMRGPENPTLADAPIEATDPKDPKEHRS